MKSVLVETFFDASLLFQQHARRVRVANHFFQHAATVFDERQHLVARVQRFVVFAGCSSRTSQINVDQDGHCRSRFLGQTPLSLTKTIVGVKGCLVLQWQVPASSLAVQDDVRVEIFSSLKIRFHLWSSKKAA